MVRLPRIHLPYFTSSLRFRLLLMFLLMALVTVGLVAWFSEHNTTVSFKTYVAVRQQSSLSVAIAGLDNYNMKSHYNPDLQAEQAMVDQISQAYGVPIIVVNLSGSIIAATEAKLTGQILQQESVKTGAVQEKEPTQSLATLSCVDLPINTVVVSIDASVFCPTHMLVFNPKPGYPPDQSFLDSVAHSILSGVCLAVLIALLLALAFSYTIIKPIKRMTSVARRVEEGDLSQRLTVKTHNEISELAHAFNTMADSLQRSEHLRRNMINDIAHELRTPLTNIRGYLEAVQDQVVDPTPETIASLYEESTLLIRLVTDLQELSLAEAGQLCLLRRPVALNECILKAVHMLRLRAAQKEIALKVDLPPGLPWVEADPERVGQILRNLLGNAITHTPEGGEITISALEREDEVVVSVQDTGCGIEEQHLPYIFERFYRADSSRTRSTGGSGLGLAIVKQMVQAHGGQVSVESQPGQGSCFVFTLPALIEGLLLDYELVGN